LGLGRASLNFRGGGAALAMGVASLPFLRVGGMNFFRLDALAGLDATARARRLVIAMVSVYAGFTLLFVILLWLVGMSGFDAWVHALGAMSTGGASTWGSSLGHYDKLPVTLVAVVAMIVGGLPLPLLLAAVLGNPKALWRDHQVRWYIGVIVVTMVLLTYWMMRHWSRPWGLAWIDGLVAAVSAVTGTGYATQAGRFWTGFPGTLLLFVSLLGGCAGSTSGGLKVFRLQALLSDIWAYMGHLLRPHAVRTVTLNKRVLYRETREQIAGFVFVYAVSFSGLAWGLGAVGLDMTTALASAASVLSNSSIALGSLLGNPGAYGNFPDAAKWLLVAGMIFGRFEMFPILVLFTVSFWRK
jgi:trk system potassium uptake protein TrkH